jgi:hypothetical protein
MCFELADWLVVVPNANVPLLELVSAPSGLSPFAIQDAKPAHKTSTA